MAKVVVFGGDGFIGRHLVKSLSANKSDEIYVFDRFSESQSNGKTVFDGIDNVYPISGDFFNRTEVNEILKDTTYVFHLISTTNPATSYGDPLVDIDTNIRGSVELFQACAEKGVKRVIFLSSGGTIYGEVDSDKINEQTIPRPLSPYGIGKLTIEYYLNYFLHSHGVEYVVYRVANPYGPGQNLEGKQGVVSIFMNQYLKHGSIKIYGDGSMKRDYIYIDDVVQMILKSFKSEGTSRVYNLGSGRGTSINEIVQTIESCVGYSIKKEHLQAPTSYVKNSVLDITLFVDDFGVKPVITLEEGIRRTWHYIEKVSGEI